jgi:hypothetical protein
MVLVPGGFKMLKVIMLVLVSLMSLGAFAQDKGVVLAAGEQLIVLRTTEFGLTAPARADVINERLRTAIGEPIKASDITVRAVSRVRADILLKGTLLIAVGATEAKAHKANVLSLADVWAQRCKDILPKVCAGETPAKP